MINRKDPNLAVTDGPPRTLHLADYGNIVEECYYGNMANTEEHTNSGNIDEI